MQAPSRLERPPEEAYTIATHKFVTERMLRPDVAGPLNLGIPASPRCPYKYSAAWCCANYRHDLVNTTSHLYTYIWLTLHSYLRCARGTSG
jgi:hypothetical protein